MAQIFEFGLAAHENVEVEEMGIVAGVEVVIGRIGRDRHRDFGNDVLVEAATRPGGFRCIRFVPLAALGSPPYLAVSPYHCWTRRRSRGYRPGCGSYRRPLLSRMPVARVALRLSTSGCRGWAALRSADAIVLQTPGRRASRQPTALRRPLGRGWRGRGVGQDGTTQPFGVDCLIGDELVRVSGVAVPTTLKRKAWPGLRVW